MIDGIKALYAGKGQQMFDAPEDADASWHRPRPCGCVERDRCLHGLAASIGVDEPLTHRVGDYFGISRDNVPEK